MGARTPGGGATPGGGRTPGGGPRDLRPLEDDDDDDFAFPLDQVT